MGWMVGDGGVEQIALRYLHIAHGEDQVGLLYIALTLQYLLCRTRMPIHCHYVIHYTLCIMCCNATIVVATM